MTTMDTTVGSAAIPRLPTNPKGLTPEVLDALIGQRYPGTRVASVDLLETIGIDALMVSTTGRGKIQLRYADNPHGLPERVQVKMIVDKKTIVPTFLYECEVNIYRKLLDPVPVERPMCLAAEYESDTQNFVLLLEDLTVRGAKFTNVLLPPLTPEEVGRLLEWLATLHAHYWRSPALEKEEAWLGRLTGGPHFDGLDNNFIIPLMEANVAASTYRQDFVTRVGHSPAELWAMVKAVWRHHDRTLPLTLCHGDTGAHNTYRLPDGTCGFYDWQLSCRATWPHDVHYIIVTALSVKDRRAHERALLQRYLDKLASLGVDYRPTIDEAVAEYSLAIMWGMTIGWFAVPGDMYGMEIISANMERLFAAITDHDVLRRAEKLL